MFKLLYDPLAEIKSLKKTSYSRLLLYVLSSSMFANIGALFVAFRFFDSFLAANLASGVIFLLFALILAHFILAFFLSVALHVLDGKGGYYEGLCSVTLGFIAPSVTLFFSGALAFLPFGNILACLLLSYGFVLGCSTSVRCAKELFEIDYAGVFIGFLITLAPLACLILAFIR